MLSGRVSSLSPVQRSHSDCGLSECDREVSTLKRPWSTRAVAPLGERELLHRNNATRKQLTSLNERQSG